MSSRYPPSTRDRSPPRYDRRPSAAFTPSSSQRDPPRGPKADFRGGGNFSFSPAPRGRGGGFPPRASDAWDRDRDRDRERDRERDRDARPAPQSYRARDDDRTDWPRRERDFPPADRPVASARDSRPYVGRERSASPIRPRRDSRESLPSTYSRLPDSSSYYPPASRGGLGRGRGRGDWDRSRGRNSFVGDRERDLFHARSRSREGWRDRDFDHGRPPPGEADRPAGFDRRDFDRSREREVRGRESRDHDIWQRDQSPARASAPSAPAAAAPPAMSINDRPGKLDLDAGRRPSVVATPTSAARDGRRDGESGDYFGNSRPDTTRRDPPPSVQQPAVAVGLDYGPPPSLPTATTPATEKPTPVKQPVVKTEAPTPSSSSFQPPSGPKAGRTTTTTGLGQAGKPTLHQDSWSRTEPVSRSIRPSLTPTTSHISTEGVSRKEEVPIEPKPPAAPAADRSLPPNIPSGPRLGTAPSYKQRLPSSEPIGPALTPTVSRESLKPSAQENRPPAIPTGPRSDREVARPMLNASSGPWLTSRDRPGFIPTGPRQSNTFSGQPQKPRPIHASGSPIVSAPSGPKALIATSPRLQEAKMTLLPPRKHIDEIRRSEDVDMSGSATSGDEDDEVEDDSFDEEYFAESEGRHKQEMKLLEARKPAPLLEDPTVVALMIKLQFLEMISRETVARPLIHPVEVTKEETPTAVTVPTEIPSPHEPSDETKLDEGPKALGARRRPLKEPPVNPIPTPPIETLPYLKSEAPHRVIFEDSDNEVEHEAVSILLQQEFEREAWDLRSDLEEMHAEFKFKYPIWKQEINHIEQERREQQASPAPASPAPSAAPSVTPSLAHERTRGARNTIEADLEAALLLSKQSAKEEEERREREAAASSLPNYDTEAVIPPMLTTSEIELSKFEDTNNLIANKWVRHKFAFFPPQDDFTDEEQTLFITAYCQSPKKWSKIAESIPGRTYQECIAHYYLTKDHTRYKEIFKRSQPRKRGRGKGASKPRSTALMSELLRGEDPEGTPVAVTDSGRPRRAAAPTFGDAPSEADPSTPVPQSKKLTAALSNPDATVTKPTRGRKTGGGPKPRRTKAQMQADQQQAMLLSAPEASPGKPGTNAKLERGRTTLRPSGGELLSSGTGTPPAAQAQRVMEAGLQQYPVPDISLVSAMPQVSTTSAVTSYWSVPEQHKFPELLSYFGRDFAAIADFMKTKSVTMIKNYYSRQINDGKDDFEIIAKKAEGLRMAGKDLGQPPSPIAPAKRRYDTTPSLAPAVRVPIQPDLLMLESELPAPAIKPAVIDEFAQNVAERTSAGDLVPKPHTLIREASREVTIPTNLAVKPGDLSRSGLDRPPLYGPKPHGPKAGFFQDEVSMHAARHPSRGPLQERSPQVLAQRLPEPARNELTQQSSMPALSQGLLGPREPLVQSQHQPQPNQPSLAQALQSQGEKYPQPGLLHPGHSRNNSLATPNHPVLETPQDTSSLHRPLDGQRPLFGVAMTGSPGPTTTSISASQLTRPEIIQPSAAPPAQDPPKPPVKRSNVFGLLNDDPPDPPPKRPSLETPKRTSILSPQIAPLPPSQMPLQHPRGQLHHEDSLASRAMRSQYGQSSGQQSPAEFSGSFSAPPATAPSTETWLDRFDPRSQGAPIEQRAHRHSPAPSQYSVVPPGSGPPPHHALRIDAPRALERPGMDHRRALLGQMNQMAHAPSPPQQSTQPVPPLRSASTSSQHSRVPSLGYGSQSASQSSSLGHPSVPQNHPQSASSTPVSSLHQRSQPSLDFPPRLTIQQHMAQQQQQSQQKQEQQQREHERQMQRQREMEVAAQRERERERDHQQQHMRRDIFGLDHHPGQTASRQNQLSATANQSHMAFGAREIPRTYTPPHTHGHSLSHSHSQFPGPGGHGPGSLGPTHGLQHQHQHQHQQHQQHQQQHHHHHQHQHSLQPQPQHQPGPPPSQHHGASPLHLQHPHHPQPPQSQILHPGPAGHFRTISQGEGRRDERR